VWALPKKIVPMPVIWKVWVKNMIIESSDVKTFNKMWELL